MNTQKIQRLMDDQAATDGERQAAAAALQRFQKRQPAPVSDNDTVWLHPVAMVRPNSARALGLSYRPSVAVLRSDLAAIEPQPMLVSFAADGYSDAVMASVYNGCVVIDEPLYLAAETEA